MAGFTGCWWTAAARRPRSSTTATACTGFTTTSRRTAFYFAAEAKAILAVRPELRRVDPKGLGEFVALGCVLENRTLFEGIHVLPPASAWSFRNGSIERQASYFQPQEWEEQEPLEPEAYYRELREVFSRNLPRYFNGSQRIGMSLTGGLDTRAIMAWHKPSPGSLPCYTFGGTYRECRDVLGSAPGGSRLRSAA